MKRTVIAATVAALTMPVGLAAPAQAWDWDWLTGRYDVAVSVDNTMGHYPLTTWGKITCHDEDGNVTGTSELGSPDAPIVVAVGDSRGMVPFCYLPNGTVANYEFVAEANGITVHCNGELTRLHNTDADVRVVVGGDPACTWPGLGIELDTFPFFFLVGNNLPRGSGAYNLIIRPITYPSWQWMQKPEDALYLGDRPLTDVVAATDVNTGDARAKNSGHMTLQPGRVTAMAERFVAAPGSPINIHGYGPDKGVAIARANHVRDHLLAEITRLGGDPADHPTFFVYGGDPGHKKNVHVTIHQHAASSITVPENGTLTIGGTS
jgi:hypothetical protein